MTCSTLTGRHHRRPVTPEVGNDGAVAPALRPWHDALRHFQSLDIASLLSRAITEHSIDRHSRRAPTAAPAILETLDRVDACGLSSARGARVPLEKCAQWRADSRVPVSYCSLPHRVVDRSHPTVPAPPSRGLAASVSRSRPAIPPKVKAAFHASRRPPAIQAKA